MKVSSRGFKLYGYGKRDEITVLSQYLIARAQIHVLSLAHTKSLLRLHLLAFSRCKPIKLIRNTDRGSRGAGNHRH